MVRLFCALAVAFGLAAAWIGARHQTFSACEAAAQATEAEMPRILSELGDRDARVRLVQIGAALGRMDLYLSGAAAAWTQDAVRGRSGPECAALAAAREILPKNFRSFMADRMLEALSSDAAATRAVPAETRF